MRLEEHADAAEFLAAAAPVLDADEARHNLIYGICSSLLELPDAFEEAYFWTVVDEGVVGAALMTPPLNMVVARPLEPDALRSAAAALHEHRVALPGVVGAIPEVEAFATAWRDLADISAQVRMRQGIYAARAVVTPAGVPGRPREAGAEDRELAHAWRLAFETEALHGETAGPVHSDWFERRLASTTAGLTLWEDDSRVVSMCGYGGRTPHGIRIGPVYTPSELRRNGYASALVAHVTQQQLESGRAYCFLYTDLANPTSNRIYMNLGYEFVCESADYRFT